MLMRQRLGLGTSLAGKLGKRLGLGRRGEMQFSGQSCLALIVGPQRGSSIAGSQMKPDQALVCVFVPGIVRDPARGGFDCAGDLAKM